MADGYVGLVYCKHSKDVFAEYNDKTYNAYFSKHNSKPHVIMEPAILASRLIYNQNNQHCVK